MKAVNVVAVVESVKGDGPLTLSGRAVTLGSAVGSEFHQRWVAWGDMRIEMQFVDKDGAVVVKKGMSEERAGLAAQGPLPYVDDKGRKMEGESHLFVIMPTARRQFYAPKCDQTREITLTLQELEKVKLPPRVVITPVGR